MKRSVAAVAAVLALSLAGCTAEAPAAAPTSTVDLGAHSTPTPTPTPQPGTKADPLPLGEYAPSAPTSMWLVTISDTSTDATAELIDANPYNEPREGYGYVAGTLAYEVAEVPAEAEGQPVTPAGSIEPVFVGGDGKIYTIWRSDNSAPVLNDAWWSQPDIVATTGVTGEGRFAIEVPADAVAGGQFAVRNQVSGDFVYFGPAV